MTKASYGVIPQSLTITSEKEMENLDPKRH